jgi:hypothetical protein
MPAPPFSEDDLGVEDHLGVGHQFDFTPGPQRLEHRPVRSVHELSGADPAGHGLDHPGTKARGVIERQRAVQVQGGTTTGCQPLGEQRRPARQHREDGAQIGELASPVGLKAQPGSLHLDHIVRQGRPPQRLPERFPVAVLPPRARMHEQGNVALLRSLQYGQQQL